jgi:uncharacterized protein YuzE
MERKKRQKNRKAPNWIAKQKKDVTMIFKPSIDYSKEFDCLYITWLPQLKCQSSLETDDEIIFDISEKPHEEIIGIEIMDFSKRIKAFAELEKKRKYWEMKYKKLLEKTEKEK